MIDPAIHQVLREYAKHTKLLYSSRFCPGCGKKTATAGSVSLFQGHTAGRYPMVAYMLCPRCSRRIENGQSEAIETRVNRIISQWCEREGHVKK